MLESSVESVYGSLIMKFRVACRDGNKDLAERVDAAIRLFEELWPDDCKRWNDRFSDKEGDDAQTQRHGPA